jgi:hypothetical protein
MNPIILATLATYPLSDHALVIIEITPGRDISHEDRATTAAR